MKKYELTQKIKQYFGRTLYSNKALRDFGDVKASESEDAAKTDVEELTRLRAENGELRRLLTRYRDETPLGHQPHMIAHLADEALGRGPNAK